MKHKLDCTSIYKIYVNGQHEYVTWDGSRFSNKENIYEEPDEIICLGINFNAFKRDIEKRNLV